MYTVVKNIDRSRDGQKVDKYGTWSNHCNDRRSFVEKILLY